ncbi:cytochrome C oxidase subunit I [Streptomyces pluripotens]|uniref:Cytochrome C oxidase subunit I n=1 Tax=Streptomyces pluripotens TaxID=1355015 RepID=A0A221P790_9ACTN|nr:cytochrome C oxidase subunit I [Streptomyces pluripotens]KIE26747.1 cytochrome C oxidase subunit I [Streptomyces sp. MUSC 125]MCH0559227.1 cytochrome C oxidase subunit I [Streptomyces sp. MUM 16J]
MSDAAEGYLLWHARLAEAEQRAREFTGPMEWLTTSQRVEIEQCYAADSLRRARKDLERVAARCASLRAEYEHRYEVLRRRCVGWSLAACLGVTTLAAVLLIF